MSVSRLVWFSGLAAMLGGMLWVSKAGSIMLTGVQPPLIFELAQFLVAFSLIGLYLQLDGRSKRLGRLGLGQACWSLASLIGLEIYALLPGAVMPVDEQFIFPSSLFILGASLGVFGGLLALGIATWRVRPPADRRRYVPLGVTLFPLPAWAASAIHFELPILLIGLAWILLGYFLWYTIGNKTDPSLI